MIRAQAIAGHEDSKGVAMLVERTGLVRTLGGVDVYLALRARSPGLTREAVDALVARGALGVRPAARGCMYLVPASLIADGLRLAERVGRARTAREHAKVGLAEDELEAVASAVMDVLNDEGPKSTSALRAALPPGTVRSLGDAGKKVGISSPLPPALRRLELAGRIERAPEGGRLDTERYVWQIPTDDPFSTSPAPEDDTALFARLGDLFFRAAGVATARAFATWLGISQRDARASMARLPLIPVQVEGWKEEGSVHEAHRALLAQCPKPNGVGLLPFADNLLALRGSLRALIDPALHTTPVPAWGRSKPSTLGEVRNVQARTIVAGDRLVGAWELDPDSDRVVWSSFGPLDQAFEARIDRAAADTATFLNRELGHGRSFSIDSEKKMRARVAYVRGLGRG